MGGSPGGRFFLFFSWKFIFMVSWSTIERSSFQVLQLPKTGPCKFSHFVIGNEAPYLTKLPLLWQVSSQTHAHLHHLPCAHWSLGSNRSYTFAPSPALSSWRHKTTPGAAAPHHETRNFVGIIGFPGFGALKTSMFRSSLLPESSPTSSFSAILNLVRMARRRNRSVPIHSWILSWHKVCCRSQVTKCRWKSCSTLAHHDVTWRGMTQLCCANVLIWPGCSTTWQVSVGSSWQGK